MLYCFVLVFRHVCDFYSILRHICPLEIIDIIILVVQVRFMQRTIKAIHQLQSLA